MQGSRTTFFRLTFASLALVAVPVVMTPACSTRSNYLGLEGPRYAGDFARALVGDVRDTGPWLAAGPAPLETVTVVSYNLRYGREVEAAIEVLAGTPELAEADVILLQEMDALGVERVADALGYSFVYYPAALRRSGRDFGNAVLTRGRIVADGKVLLPHRNPINRQQRIAVHAELELGAYDLSAYSVHTETPFLPLRSRVRQIDELLASVPDDGGPCLFAGDFNTMSARSLRRFETAFANRGFQRVSAGLGATFGIGPLGFELDHVFARGLEVVRAGKVDDAGASDHDPIWVELAWSS